MDEIILVDKPGGMTSFGVVARVRRRLSERAGRKVKVGHTGTLDPFATGLLILLSGKSTKRAGEFLKLDKVYEAAVRLGAVSSTGDVEGEISYSAELSEPTLSEPSSARRNQNYIISPDEDFGASKQANHPKSSNGADVILTGGPKCSDKVGFREFSDVQRVVKAFVGEIEQRVPMYSAVKIGGERAYRLARRGVEVEMPVRKVEIYSIEILRYEWPELVIRTHVSSGTYIRALAQDIGEALGVGGYLTELRRIKVGNYEIRDAKTIEEV